MKKTLKILTIILLIGFIFRGWIYRLTINYKDIGTRTTIKITNEKLIQQIKLESANKQINLAEILDIANSITNKTLRFTGNRASNDPNTLITTNRANCVGYSALFNSIANYLIQQNALQQEIEAKHKIGQLDFLGIDLHQFFNSPFFKDHDFNQLKSLKTGETVLIDPSVSDYLWIKRVDSNVSTK